MPEHQKPHVLIIGAGITGLLIAQGLKKAGVPYTIFEAEEASTFRPREWTMGIHWGAPLMKQLLPEELVARLSEAYVDPSLDYLTPPTNGSAIYDGVSGELLKRLVPEGQLIRVSRRKLRTLCSYGVDTKFGHKLEKLDCDSDGIVKTVFANGQSYEGTVVVGTDGPRSTVRQSLFSPKDASTTSISDIVNLTAVFSYGDAEKAKTIREIHPVWAVVIHPDIFFFISVQDATHQDKPETWQFFVTIGYMGERDSSLSNAERMKLVKDKASALEEPFRSAIQWMPEDTDLPYGDMNFWISEPWNSRNGRVTLAGDAAHPMPPYRGQGLNHAIQDAHNFVQIQAQLLNDASADRERLIQDYGDEVAKRGAEEVAMSKQNGYMMLGYYDMKNSPYMKQGLNKS